VGSKLELADVDGGSIKDLVYGKSDEVKRPNPFLVFHDKSASPKSSSENADSETALMQGDFKLIKTWKGGKQHTMELYDLASDPGEANDLAASMPGRAASMGHLVDNYITRWRGDVTIDHDDWPPKPKKRN
jgi:hypothetical protein